VIGNGPDATGRTRWAPRGWVAGFWGSDTGT